MARGEHPRHKLICLLKRLGEQVMNPMSWRDSESHRERVGGIREVVERRGGKDERYWRQ